MKKLLTLFAAIVGPAAIMAAGAMGAGSTSSLILAGAWFRYDLLWLAILVLPLFIIAVDSASRIGLINQDRGMFSLVGHYLHPTVAWLIIAIHVPVHIFVGMAHMSLMTSASMSLFGFSPEGVSSMTELALAAGLSLGIIWLLTSEGYERMQKIMTACVLVMFVCFMVVAFRGFQEISAILAGLTPSIPDNLQVPGTDTVRDSGLSILALIGSVLAPGALFGMSYLSADNSLMNNQALDLKKEFRTSVINLGFLYGGYSIFVIVAGGFALYPLANHAEIDSVSEASQILARAFPDGISFLAPIVFSLGMLVAAITTYVVVVEVTTYALLDIAGKNWHYAKDNKAFKRTLIAIILIPGLLSPFWEFPALAKNLLLMGVNTVVIPLGFFVLLFLLNKKAVMGDHTASLPRNIILGTGFLISISLSIYNLPKLVQMLTG